MSAGPSEIDPVRFCSVQVDRLSERLDHVERALVEQVLPALIQAREQRVQDVLDGVEQVLDRLTNDSKFGSLHYSSAADHMGRRWYDTLTSKVGRWLLTLIGGAIGIAALVWYVGTTKGVK